MKYEIEPTVIMGEGVLTPPHRARWVTPEMYRLAGEQPQYTIKEAAILFGKNGNWLRKRIDDRRYPLRTPSGHRRFGLHHIEGLAHELLQARSISPLQFAMVIRSVKSLAILSDYQIGDSGFLLEHWNGATHLRRRALTLVMERLEHLDAQAVVRLPDPVVEQLVSAVAQRVRDLEEREHQRRRS